jgi:hypothetical protein
MKINLADYGRWVDTHQVLHGSYLQAYLKEKQLEVSDFCTTQ